MMVNRTSWSSNRIQATFPMELRDAMNSMFLNFISAADFSRDDLDTITHS